MKITAKRVDRDIATSFKRGSGLDPVEVDSPVEYWRVCFETEKKDTLTSDFPSWDEAYSQAESAIWEAGYDTLHSDVRVTNYHLESGGAWGMLVLEVRLEKA